MNTEFATDCRMLNCPIRSIDNVCDHCRHIAPDSSENGQRDRARDVAVALEQENTELRSILATIGQVRVEGMRCTCPPEAAQPCAAEWLDILLKDAARVGADALAEADQ